MGNERHVPSGVVELCELGHLGVRSGGQWHPIGGERTRAAVAALALHRDDGVTTEALIDAVWPSPSRPATARQSLANLIARLRANHGNGFVETTAAGYRLGRHVESDRERFGQAVGRAAALIEDAPAEALDTIDHALGYVRGQPWHDVEFPVEIEADRAQLEIAIHRARRIRARALAVLGRHAEAIPEFEAVLAHDPVDELSWYQLATSHAGNSGRVDALRSLRRARRHLGEHGLTLSDAAAELERRVLSGSSGTGHATAEIPMTPTSLIGRDAFLGQLIELLVPGAAVTLLGPAGIGKTRLVIELARRTSAHNTYFVDLSAVLDADLVPSAVAAALAVVVEPGTAPTDALLDHLGDDEALLVLDNCEQVVRGVAALVASLVVSCRSCTVVATSRERLRVPVEQVVRVEPLSPVAGVELFLERARQHGADLPADVWRESVADLCRSLDGLPLAIELAAARTTVLSPTEILAALDDRLRMLRDPDGTGLEDAIRWSWDLLDDAERTALHRLSVFHSGATLDAASSVWRLDRWETLDLAEQLARKSLLEIRQSPAAPTRFEMLDSIRYFVLADAERTGVLAGCRDRHLTWVDEMTLCAQGPHGFSGEAGGMDMIDRERHEIRAGLDHAGSQPVTAARGAMICHRLFGWWRARSAAREAFELLDALLHCAELTPGDRAATTATLASLARIAAIPEHTVSSLCSQAERLLGGVEPSLDRDLIELRLMEATFDDRDQGLGTRLRRLADAQLDDECGTALHLLAAWSITNDPNRAGSVADEFWAYVASSNEPLDGHPRELQGLAAVVTGKVSEASERLTDALALHLDCAKTFCAIHCAEGVAWLAIEAGEVEAGRSLLAATEGVRRTGRRSRAGFEEPAITGVLRHLGTLPEPDLDADIDATIATARSIAERLATAR